MALTLRARVRRAWQQLIVHGEGYLAAQAGELSAAGVAVVAEVRSGCPAETIVQIAAERRSGMSI